MGERWRGFSSSLLCGWNISHYLLKIGSISLIKSVLFRFVVFFYIGCAAPNEKPLHTPAYHHLETIIHSSVSYRLINTTLCPCSAFQRSSNSAWCCLSAEQQSTLLILSHLTIANLATLTFSFFLHKRKKNANSK